MATTASMRMQGSGAKLAGAAWMSLALGLTVWIAVGIAQAWLAPRPPAVGGRPPPLTVQTTDGARFALPGLGKVAVIDFWRPDCVGCVGQTRILNRLQDRFDGRIEIIAVSDAGKDEVARFVRARAVRYPVALDEAGWTRRFGVIAYPTLVLVGADGRVAAIHKRGVGESALVRAVEALLPPSRDGQI